jgi:hypothetical protein
MFFPLILERGLSMASGNLFDGTNTGADGHSRQETALPPAERMRHVDREKLARLRRSHDLTDAETWQASPWDQGHWANRKKK